MLPEHLFDGPTQKQSVEWWLPGAEGKGEMEHCCLTGISCTTV